MRSSIVPYCLSLTIAGFLLGCGGCDEGWSCTCAQEPAWTAVVEVSDTAEHRLSGASLTFAVNGGEPRSASCDDVGICTANGGTGLYEMQVQRDGYLPKELKVHVGFSTCGATTFGYVSLQKRT
jgi:hypothetical protein